MTNHSEAAGTPGNSDITGQNGCGGREDTPAYEGRETHPRPGAGQPLGHSTPGGPAPLLAHGASKAHVTHGAPAGPYGEQQVTLRTPAELADALPYLLGYRPEDSIVLVALHDREARGRFGGRARLGIPAQTDDWPSVAQQLAHGLVTGSERRGAKPESMVAFLCQDPTSGESARDVMERLRPLAQLLRKACGALDVPVVEALCISDGRFWSYCCPGTGCCLPEGEPMGLPGTSVLAAAATYAGLQVRGTLRELRARLMPWETAAALEQEAALDAAQSALIPRILDSESRAEVAEETLAVAHRIMGSLADVPTVSSTLDADLHDDELIGHADAATLILGLQDRATRDRAAEWMEGDEAGPALRLWRALARRCVGPYGEHAAAPLTLAGWVAWSTGDELEAREALAMALAADSDYLFARLLHQACNEGLDPESVRRCLRAERRGRDLAAAGAGGGVDGAASGTAQSGDTSTVDLVADGEPSLAVFPGGAGAAGIGVDGEASIAARLGGAAIEGTGTGGDPSIAAQPHDSRAPSDRICGTGTGTGARRRPRPEGRSAARAIRRSPSTARARRARSVDEGSPGRRPGRAADGASGRARVRRGGGEPGAEGDT
ncbi:DUF4192 domain-containing protein [Streptomyces ipomoeae]|uniref:DUF4192 domain-containing protein n=1 Tax=Streptomyces ipomoeae TaxID=103232 RepID=UPI00215CDD42|nr:DUF4192 domain-containing protein [Streptomyces ipomoeae]MDX2823681.1 DUF4192 domain-containing protein [Streptomyces ipomoeae]MDX2876281.1 DUF4192 domain-containing protein [Streptomyces ipomoeae]